MKLDTLDMIRIWAAITGILLALVYFLQVFDGMPTTDTLPMLIAGIGGFEAFLFGQDRARRKRSGGTNG